MAEQQQSHAGATEGSSQILYEGLRVQLIPAPFWKRFLAFCIDLGIIMAIMYPLFFVGLIGLFALVGIGEALLEGAGGLMAVPLILLGLLMILSIQDGYFILQERRGGTTVGKRIFGLRVTSEDGRPLTWGQAVLRDVMRYIDCFLVFPALFSVLMNEKRKRLGDMMAGTMVVHSASREKSQSFLYISSEEYGHLEQILRPQTIEVTVAEEYLKYAFPRLILGQATDNALDQRWVEYFKQFVHSSAEADAIPPLRLLRFFAERCVQWKNNMTNGVVPSLTVSGPTTTGLTDASATQEVGHR